jgi:Domain of unknown function (DUF3850)
MPTVHELKCWPPYFDDIETGQKLVDIRLDDRRFQVGDILFLREYVPPDRAWRGDIDADGFTGRTCQRQITHILSGGQFGLAEGYVALSLRHLL